MLKIIVPVAGFVLVAGAAYAQPPPAVVAAVVGVLDTNTPIVIDDSAPPVITADLPGATSVSIDTSTGEVVGTVDPGGAVASEGTIDSTAGPPPVTATPGGVTPGP